MIDCFTISLYREHTSFEVQPFLFWSTYVSIKKSVTLTVLRLCCTFFARTSNMSICTVQQRFLECLTIQSASYAANCESVFAVCAESCFALFDAVTLKVTTMFQSNASATDYVTVGSASQANGLHMSLKSDGSVYLWDMNQNDHLVSHWPCIYVIALSYISGIVISATCHKP